MPPSDEQVRAFVWREVARHLGRDEAGVPGARPMSSPTTDVSHARLKIAPGAATGEVCVIEPAVRCNNCGYCQSYGH